MRQRKAVTKELRKRYNRATKKKKTIMLDEFCAVTGYNRSYASWILKIKKDKVLGYVKTGGRTIKFVAEKKKKKKKKKGRPRIYTYDVFLALRKIWVIFDFICGKRLAPFMAEAVRKLEKHKELDINASVRKKLKSISPSTIDRLLKKEKEKFRLGKGRSGTKPGTLLKKSIPIRTFADWDNAVPGFTECDLVAHDGGNSSGDFAQSLNFTDIATCWDSTAAAANKAQVHVFRALRAIVARFPFKVKGIDSDNGCQATNNLHCCGKNMQKDPGKQQCPHPFRTNDQRGRCRLNPAQCLVGKDDGKKRFKKRTQCQVAPHMPFKTQILLADQNQENKDNSQQNGSDQ